MSTKLAFTRTDLERTFNSFTAVKEFEKLVRLVESMEQTTVDIGPLTDLVSEINSTIEAFIEAFTNSVKTITTDHSYIHEGKAFRINGKTGSLSPGSKTNVALVTPPASLGYIHMRPALFASTANLLEIRITQGETISGGTALDCVNQNANSPNTAKLTAKSGVTATPSGRSIGLYSIGSGGSPSAPKSGGSAGEANEILLLPDTTYLVEFENIGSATATVAYYNFFWYEESRG